MSGQLDRISHALGSFGPWFWIALLAALLVLPFYLPRKQPHSFFPFTPLTFPVWTYLAPVFVGGSVLLMAGLAHHPMVPGLVPSPVTFYYSLALAYLVVGWAGLLLGYYSPFGALVGQRAERLLPRLDWTSRELRLPTSILLLFGAGCYWLCFSKGLIGYQRTAAPGRFDALLIYATGLTHAAAFLLWFSLFARSSWRWAERLLAVALVLLGPAYLVITASRAALFVYLLAVSSAYCLAGRRITRLAVAAFLVLAALSLVIGFSWSTTFRQVKGNESMIGGQDEHWSTHTATTQTGTRTDTLRRISARRLKTLRPPLAHESEYPEFKSAARTRKVSETDNRLERTREESTDTAHALSKLSEDGRDPPLPKPSSTDTQPARPSSQKLLRNAAAGLVTETAKATSERTPTETLTFVLTHLGQRVEITSSLAVLVANYKHLKTEEQESGIADNIFRDTLTAIVPRALWPNKPKVSDARAYSKIYFRHGESSYAMTPVGDLLRNFGPLGVPLGMALLGGALRLLGRLLIEGQAIRAPRAAIYMAVLTSVSYEGFFGSIFPVAIRVAALTIAGVLAVHCGILLLRWLRSPA